MDNIVNWGLVASAWAPITEDENGNDVYGTVHKFRGARSISWTANGDFVNVYADGTTVYTGKNNDGYDGSMEFTNPDEDFLAYALGEETDSNGLQYEPLEPTVNRFALLWEWEGDLRKTRHCMYNCTARRPDLSVTTKGDGGSKNPQYQTINLKAIARVNDDVVKIRTKSTTDATVYANWFNSVPTIASAGTQKVTVTVKVSTTPIAGALVILGDGTMGVTDAAGQIIFYKPNGTYDVFVSKSGYTAEADSITVNNAAVSKDIAMTAE